MNRLATSMICALLLSGCQNTPIKTEGSVSGFVGDYSVLKEVTAEDGEGVLRWASPEISQYAFDSLILDPVILYPADQDNTPENISSNVRKEILNYFDQALKAALSQHYHLTDQTGPKTVRLRVALTGITLSNEGLKPSELLPFGAAIGLIRTATGVRNKNVSIFIEVQLEDSQSNVALAKVVRSGVGQKLRMIWSPEFTLEHVTPIIDEWALLAKDSLHQVIDRKP